MWLDVPMLTGYRPAEVLMSLFRSSPGFALIAALTLFVFASGARGAPPEPTYATGLTFASDAAYRSIPLAAPPLMGPLPASADLSADFPEPGQQGTQGSCVGWAIAYAVRSHDAAKRQQWRPDSSSRRFSPAYVFNQITRSPICQGSTYIDALNLLSNEGVALERDFPYDPNQCSLHPSAAVRSGANRWRIQTWRRVNVQDTSELKTHLAAGFPVLIGAEVDQAFQALGPGTVYLATGGRQLGGHAMAVVGYDDARRAFKIINSWGTGWGDRGFGWIGYDVFRQIVREGFVIQDFRERVTDPNPSLTPNPVPPAAPTASVTPPQAQAVMLLDGPGANFSVPGHLRGARGRTAQVVLRFGLQTPNGIQPIPANAMSPFRDFNGGVATGTQPFPVQTDDLDLSRLTISIPLAAINAVGTIYVQADVYVDNFNIARSGLGTFPITPPVGNFCCDNFDARRCSLFAPNPLGSSCFCPGQGYGITCQ